MTNQNPNKWPPNDDEWEDLTVESVEKAADGWTITRQDGWCFHVPKESPIEPIAGMRARFYGRGVGGVTRGLFIEEQQVFYRTEAEQSEFMDIELYGVDAADWLKRWDEGRSVWSIEMGGLGPGYEQAIQITVAEILRIMLDHKPDGIAWVDAEVWKKDRDDIEKVAFGVEAISRLGLSGAQFGAAMGLAAQLYRFGPREVMKIEEVKKRHIQVSRTFPAA